MTFVILFKRGIHSSCHSEGNSEGSASAPGWSPGPSDPGPACGAYAPGEKCARLNEEGAKTDENELKETTQESL